MTGTHSYRIAAFSLQCGESLSVAQDSGTGHVLSLPPKGSTFIRPPVCDSIRLAWNASGGEVEGYVVRKDGDIFDTTSLPRYTDHAVIDSPPHRYRVAALNSFCGPSEETPEVVGRALPPVAFHAMPDTVFCPDTLCFPLEHCGGDEMRADFFLFLNGGPFLFAGSAAPIPDTPCFPLSDTLSAAYDVRIMAVSHRLSQADTALSESLVLDCRPDALEVEQLGLPADFIPDQNYPNPFNPTTTIRFGLPHAANVRIEVFDLLGRRVATLLDEVRQPGWHHIVWGCSSCATGMYVLRLQTGEKVLLRKLLRMK